jgi:hypothetical protein
MKQANLSSLTEAWKLAKAAEAEANARRVAIESRIYELVADRLPDKGTATLETGMKVVTGFSEEWDQDQLRVIAEGWNARFPFPFLVTYKPDGKAVAYVRDMLPEVYALFRDALTLKPKKPAFSVKE